MESTAKDGSVQRQESIWCAVAVERQSNRMCFTAGYLGCHAPLEKEW